MPPPCNRCIRTQLNLLGGKCHTSTWKFCDQRSQADGFVDRLEFRPFAMRSMIPRSTRAIKTAMIAITISNSTSVKPDRD